MKWKLAASAIMVLSLAACSNKHRPTGQIFERREATGNKLMIKYTYLVDGQQKVDSVTIDNVALPGDSINVKRFLNHVKKH
jgi:outer membrane lipoprotein SlyB